MDDEVEIQKLSIAEVFEVQKLVTKMSKSKDDSAQLTLIQDLIRMAVIGAKEISDEDFKTFPIGELSTLSEEIMKFSGLTDAASGN